MEEMEMQADNDWMVPLEMMLGSLDQGEVHACSITRVPDELGGPKEEAYKPKLVSIGPLHREATRLLLLMEEPKWRYMKEFLRREDPQVNDHQAAQEERSQERLGDCGIDILQLDQVIRACYGGNMKLEPYELAKIMIVDGCFLLELLLRLQVYMDQSQHDQTDIYSNDPLLETEEKVLAVVNDITMLENQIPFIVLKKLFRKVYPDGSEIEHDHRVANVMRRAFGYPLENSTGAAHILHMMHLSTVGQGQQEGTRVRQVCQELKRCATRLLAAGITIKAKPPNSNNTLHNRNDTNQHKFIDKFNFDISFRVSDKVLEIPPLHIKEATEVRWRNLIAWEQSRIWIRGKYTSYALFFQGLICCKHDIELLEEVGVIVNESKKSKEELLNMFLTMLNGAEHMDSSYTQVCASLNAHRAKKVTRAFHEFPIITWHQCRFVLEIIVFYWRNWYNVLIREHIPTVWKLIGVLAAILLLALTIMQTYYAAAAHNG